MVLKLEFMQHTGSFKARGAFNRILSAAEAGQLPAQGVISASGGNSALRRQHPPRRSHLIPGTTVSAQHSRAHSPLPT